MLPFDSIASLARVRHFDNATQSWSFSDPCPDLADAVTYTDPASGDIVWIYVRMMETFQGHVLIPGWNVVVIR